MPLYLCEKEEFLDIIKLVKKSAISCVVCKYKSMSSYVARENPLWISKQYNLVNEFENSFFLVDLPSYQ